jgi:hypothetical protein
MAPHKNPKERKPVEDSSAERRRRNSETLEERTEELEENIARAAAVSPENQADLLSRDHSSGQRAQLAMHLQQTRGNAYVQRLVESPVIQAKLSVNPPDDVYEREADRVAETVQRQEMPEEEEELQAKRATGLQRQEEEEEELQAKRATGLQRQEEEEEEIQPKRVNGLQRQEEEEEFMQARRADGLQRQPIEEEEEELQAKRATGIQRQEEEEELQAKRVTGLQRQEEEEEEIQPKRAIGLQRQEIPEEEDLQMKSAGELQRQEEEEEAVQTMNAGDAPQPVSNKLESQIDGARGGGQPLNGPVRESLENRMGHDFSGVRFHTDGRADQLSRKLGAEAFTTGSDVFFREGNFQPDTESGRGLIAHELTHVVQQQAVPEIQRQTEAETGTQAPASGTTAATRRGFDAATAAGIRHRIMTPIEQAVEEGLQATPPDIRRAIEPISEAVLAVSEANFEAGGFDEAAAAQMRHVILTPLEQAGEMLSASLSAPERTMELLSKAIVETSTLSLEAAGG